MSTGHSKLGASGAARWMNCPGSINMVESLGERAKLGSSVYAQEGTTAHALAELALTALKDSGEVLDLSTFVGMAILDGMVVNPEPDTPKELMVTDGMVEAVSIYVDEVRSQLEALPGSELHVEVPIKLDWLGRDDLWGTCDAVVVQPYGRMMVTDYKHGRGVVVDPKDNPQLCYYALGPLHDEGAGNITAVDLVVVQPRAFHSEGPVRRHTMTPDELVEFSVELAGAADATDKRDAPLSPGDWCHKGFCAARGACPALDAKIRAETALAFNAYPVGDLPADAIPAPPTAEEPDRLARALQAAPLIDSWVKAVQTVAQQVAEGGGHLPGFKLVRKRAVRRWKDAADVERRLRNKKRVSVKDIYDRKLKSPAKLEKVETIGKEWVQEHAEKPPGGLTLAPLEDKRKAVQVEPLTFPDDLPAAPALEAGDVFD